MKMHLLIAIIETALTSVGANGAGPDRDAVILFVGCLATWVCIAQATNWRHES